MKPCLIYVRPLNTKTSARVDVRVADGPSADTYGTGGVSWEPAIAQRPVMSIELMSVDMDGKVQAGTARFSLSLRELRTIANPLALYWRGAQVVIHSNGILEGPTAVPDFSGYVTDASVDLDTGRLQITAQVSTAFIDKPLLTLEFGGGGGADGDPALRGTLFPCGMGVVKNLQPIFFDTARNIAMVDGYGNTSSIDWLGEGLNSLGAAIANYSSYAALAAAVDAGNVARGRWSTAIVAGGPSYIALGAPPTGVITVHATFAYNRVGAMMKRILLGPAHANVAAARVDSGSFDTLDAALSYPARYWTAEQRNVKDLLEALAQSVNSTPLVTFQNQITVTRAVAGVTPAITLDRSGRVDPRVLDWQSGAVDPPYFLLKARAARPATTLSTDQVNYVDTIIDRGLYASGTVYRAGNLVWLADGSQWLFQNATASSGHAPPGGGATSDAYWQRLQPPKTITDFGYTGDLDATRNRWYVATSDPGGSNGDGWKDTSTTPAKFKFKVAGSWVDVSSLVTDTSQIYDGANLGLTALWSGVAGAGKPADNATRNQVTYSTTAPASPVDGDIWVDLNGTYAVFKLRNAGVWQVGANALTAYNALAGKPIALADINTTESAKLTGIETNATSADNMIVNGSLATSADGWTLGGSSWVSTGAATDPSPGEISITGGAYKNAVANGNNVIQLAGAKRLYVSGWAFHPTGYGVSVNSCFQFIRADGTNSTIQAYSLTSTASATLSSWQPFNHVIDVPSDATTCRYYLERAGSSTGTVFVTAIRVAKTEPAADVTPPLVTGPGTTTVQFDNAGAVKPAQLPLPLQFKAQTASNPDVTTLATWSAVLKSGTASFTIGASTGVLTITAFTADAQIEVTATFNGKAGKATTTIQRADDPPPVTGGSSGGGGGGTGSSASTNTITNSTASTYGSSNAGPLTVKCGSAGIIDIAFTPANFRLLTATATTGAHGKVMYRPAGSGSYALLGAEVNSTASADRELPGAGSEPHNDPGTLTISLAAASLTDGADYDFLLYLRDDINSTLTWSGTFKATAR